MRVIRIAVVGAAFLALSACAHQDLTAPCSAQSNGIFGWLPSGSAWACEELRAINGPTVKEAGDGGH